MSSPRSCLAARPSSARSAWSAAALLGFACSVFPDHAVLPSGAEGGGGSGGGGGVSSASGGRNNAGFAGARDTGGVGAGPTGGAGSPGAGAAGGGAAEAGSAGRGDTGGAGGRAATGGAGGALTGGQGGGGGCRIPLVLKLVTTADAYLSEGKNDQRTNFGSETPLLVSGVVAARARTLINFDLSALNSSQNIASATLRVVLVSAVTGERTLSVYRIGREWQEEKATWVRSMTGPNTNWALPGGDTALVPSDTQSIADITPGTAVEFDLTSDLEALVASNDPSYGWLVDAALTEDIVQFSSRESLFAEERPELVLELCP